MLPAFLLVWTLTAAPPPPAGLACLSEWYAVTPQWDAGAWFGVTPQGTRLPWSSVDNNAPTLSSTYVPAYATGPILPITDPDQDPGRNRVEALFDATYGATPPTVAATLGSSTVRVHPRIAKALARVDARLRTLVAQKPALAAFLTSPGGGYNARKISGSQLRSTHSWGVAVDLNVARSDYWRWSGKTGWKNRYPQSIVDAFEAEGFIWGGRWFHFDTMHFEYRPELLSPACHSVPASP